MNVRLVSAELLKLRKRRGLFWWTLLLTVGVIVVVFGILEGLHLADPSRHGPAGGIEALRGSLIGLTSAGAIAAILVGTMAGAGDVTAGVFRDLVATGRSRWGLFAARVPGALALFLPMITLGYVIASVCAVTLAGPLPAPGAALIAKGYGWVALSTSFDLVLALGFASLVGSRATTIGVLIGWQFIAEPLLSQVSFLGGLREGFFTGSLARLNPLPGPARGLEVTHSVVVAVLVLVAWAAAALASGGWRTATRDA